MISFSLATEELGLIAQSGVDGHDVGAADAASEDDEDDDHKIID